MTNVAVIVIIVKGQDGVVGDQVTVVEEQTVEAKTVGQLEVLGHVPLVLSIDTGLVELHAGSRLGLVAVSVGQADNLGSGTVDKVVNAVVAVVTRTITHVLVVGHLVLEAQTAHDLVVTIVPGHVVTQVPDGVVNGVVPGKELITQSHIVVGVTLGIGQDIVGAAILLNCGDGHIVHLHIVGEHAVAYLIGSDFLGSNGAVAASGLEVAQV